MANRNLNNSLQCRLCFEDYQIDHRIWQCQTGHSVCASCRNHLHQCPFCQAPYEGTRNYDIEDMIRELRSNTGRADGDIAISPDEHRQMQLPSSNENDHTEGSSVNVDIRDTVVVELLRSTQQNNSNPWMQCTSEQIPTNAMVAGRDHGGTPLCIGRAVHGKALLPGKVNRQYKTCYVPWSGAEHEKSNFEILMNISGEWVATSGGTIPVNAFAAGHSEDGETLYIGRADIEGTLALGKVHPSHGCCFISYAGREYSKIDYEIFVLLP